MEAEMTDDGCGTEINHKRAKESYSENLSASSSRPQGDYPLTVRLLCDGKEVGAILGKGGATVRELRSLSGAVIDISRAQRPDIQRIITVEGVPFKVTVAITEIVHRLAESRIAAQQQQLQQTQSAHPGDDVASTPTPTAASSTSSSSSSSSSSASSSSEPSTTHPSQVSSEVSLVLLVPNIQVGFIIGKGGISIRSTREESGAHIRVSDEMLENSTEKTVTIRGSTENVVSAATRIIDQLAETSDRLLQRPPVLYHPPGAYESPMVGQYMAYGIPVPIPGAPYVMDPYTGLATPVEPTQTIAINIPEQLVGTIIGKRGSAINEIRQRSGAHVKIADPVPNSRERLVTITGTQQANEIALALVYEKVNAAWDMGGAAVAE